MRLEVRVEELKNDGNRKVGGNQAKWLAPIGRICPQNRVFGS